MSDTLLNHGQVFEIGGNQFEVATVSTNDSTGKHRYEIISLADADEQRAQAEESAEAERKAEDERKQAELEAQSALPDDSEKTEE